MKLKYQNHLNTYAQKLRQGGNLAEVLLWSEIQHDKLGCRFLRQRPIGKYIVDFYCHTLNLVIEIDGAASHDTKVEDDITRQKALESLGTTVIRFRDADVRYNLSGVIKAIQSEALKLTEISRPSGTLFKKEGMTR